MSVLFCDEERVHQLKRYGNFLQSFLEEYTWLLGAYVLDFYTENYWEKLPSVWQEALENIQLEELSLFIEKGSYFINGKPLPLSLQAFRKVTQLLSWPRTAIPFDDVKKILESQLGSPSKKWNISTEERNGNDVGSNSNEVLKNIFRRHIKPKKKHEIENCAKVASLLLQMSKSKHVVDIGAGQGHLSRCLAFGYGFNVVALEAESCHVMGARKYDQQASYEMLKKLKMESNSSTPIHQELLIPEHVEYRLSSASTGNELSKVLSETWNKGNVSVKKSQPRFGIVGLHTCGNLAAVILRRFVDMEKASALLSVGCCYMKLNSDGFPMSNFLQNVKLSYEAKEISCHAIEMYAQKLKYKDDIQQLKIHCFRGILEKLIVSHYPEKKHMGLKSIRHSKNMPFSLYVEKALSGLSFTIPTESIASPFVETALQQWKRVVIFYSLRLLVAPLVESLILLDRMLYLHEEGITSCILPVFNPLISPRNHLLLAVKTSKI